MIADLKDETIEENVIIKVLGYCELSNEQIKRYLSAGNINRIMDAGGEYTVVYKYGKDTGIITSSIGAMHYFYYYDGTQFEHGQHVGEIVRKLGLEWKWDWTSLADLCEQENLCENRTIHESIKRVPPGSSLVFTDRLIIRNKNFLDSIRLSDANPVDAVEIFNKETDKWVSKNTHLSLSGGFDSRVILSSMLKQKIYPTVVTLGNEDSSDIQVARSIAERFGLEHKTVNLSLDDFFEYGERIAYITNGTKPACHWHTYMYPKKAGVPRDESFFVGTLGEFSRSYYLDKGIASILLDGFGDKAQERFWTMKLSRHRTFKTEEYRLISSNLTEHLNDRGLKLRAERNARLSTGGLLSGGSRYYLEQRVPNFYANGIRMYNDTTQWRSPFHNLDWLKVIWSLNDNWKLGSNWHRLAIKRNYPELLSFPEEKGFSKKVMMSKAPPLYWLPPFQRLKYRSYDLSQDWYQKVETSEFLLDNAKLIDDIIDRRLCESLLTEHKEMGTRTKGISFLLTLVFFKLAIKNGIS
jgi:asparagine synthetase B (glutamine-hydrolysing)